MEKQVGPKRLGGQRDESAEGGGQLRGRCGRQGHLDG